MIIKVKLNYIQPHSFFGNVILQKFDRIQIKYKLFKFSLNITNLLAFM